MLVALLGGVVGEHDGPKLNDSVRVGEGHFDSGFGLRDGHHAKQWPVPIGWDLGEQLIETFETFRNTSSNRLQNLVITPTGF